MSDIITSAIATALGAASARRLPGIELIRPAVLLLIVALASAAQAEKDPPINAITLDDEDRAWLREHPRVRVHLESWPPFVIDEQGSPGGIAIEYVELICGALGLEVEYVRIPWTDAVDRIRRQQDIDILPILSRTEEREAFLAFTGQYVSFPIVIFTRTESQFVGGLEDLCDRKVAIERGYSLHTALQREVPELPLLVVDTTDEALLAVATGSAEAYVGNLAVGTYLIQKHGLTDVKIAAPSPFGTHDQAMGVRKDWPRLAGILDRGLAAVTRSGHEQIRQRWLAVRYEHGLTTADIWRWVLIVLGAAAVLLGLSLVWIRRLNREVRLRRRTEAALEESRAQLVEAQRLAGIGSWRLDVGRGILTCSPEALWVAGRDPGELGDARNHREVLRGRDWSTFIAAAAASSESGEPFEVELQLIGTGDVKRWALVRGAPTLAEGPGMHAMMGAVIGTFQDINDRKLAELAQDRRSKEE